MSDHTKGPWRPYIQWHAAGQTVHVMYSDGEVVHWKGFDSSDVRDPEERAANCRLIAAAPEMLEVLKAVLQCEPRTDENGHAYLCVPARSLNDLGAIIRAVVNKAEGGTND